MNDRDNKDFDSQLRKQFTENNGKENWDLPSSNVWTGIESGLSTRRKRRVLAYWLIPATFLGLLFTLQLLTDFSIYQNPVENKVNQNGAAQEAEPSSGPAAEHLENVHSADKSSEGIFHNKEPKSILNRSTLNNDILILNAINTDINKITSKNTIPGNHNMLHSPLIDKGQIPAENERGRKSVGTEELLHGDLLHAQREIRQERTIKEPTIALEGLQTKLSAAPVSVPAIPQPETKQQISKVRMSIELFSGTNTGVQSLHVNRRSPGDFRRLLNNREQSVTGIQYGLAFTFHLPNQLFVSSGITFKEQVIDINQIHQFRYTRSGERQIGQDRYGNTFTTNLNTSFGELETDLLVQRATDDIIEENSFVTLHLRARNTLESLRFPLIIGYEGSPSRLSYSIGIGIGLDFITGHDFTQKALTFQHNRIKSVELERKSRLLNYNRTTTEFLAQGSLTYRLSSKSMLALRTDFAKSLEPIYTHESTKSEPIEIGFRFGLNYRLF